MKAKDIIKEASVMDYEPSKNRNDPAAIKAREREQALGADPFSQMFIPGVSTAQDIGDVAQGDLSAAPYVALGMVPFVGGPLRKLAKKVFGGNERGAAKQLFSKEQERLANLSPAQRQAEKEVSSSLRQPSAQTSKAKKGDEPIVKRDEPVLTTQQRSYKELDRPAVQRKAETDKATKDAAAADKSSQPRYTIDPKTGKPVPANVQAQLQQKLQGKGFKEPEPGSVSGFKVQKQPKAEPKAEPKVEPKAEPKVEPKAEPKVEPKAEVSTEKMIYDPWAKKMIPASKWKDAIPKDMDPSFVRSILKKITNTPGAIRDLALAPSAAAKAVWPSGKKTEALTSIGAHAALIAYLWNLASKESGAEKSSSAQQGDANKPVTVTLDPGSTNASTATTTSSPQSTTAAPADTKSDKGAMQATIDGGEKSLPPVVVTAEPKKVNPQKAQPVVKSDATQKAEEPKADQVMATTQPSSWQVSTDKDDKSAEADKVDDTESSQTTPAVTKPVEEPESEDDILKRLLKLFDRPTEEPKAEPAAEPKTEPAAEPKAEPAAEPKTEPPKPEPVTKPNDGKGKADAEKGDADKRGDEKTGYPKFDRGEKNELPTNTEKKGSDTTTRKTDSAVNIGPATTGKDNLTNYVPPEPTTTYDPSQDRASTIRRNELRQRSRRGADNADLETIPRMEPVRESLDHILALANITKKEIVESTMNIDMRQMLQLLDEAAKMADIKGKKHTGKYGKEYDTDEEGDEKSKAKAEPAEKKGRGRPKKDSNVEAGKYKGADDAAKHLIGGSAPKGKSKLPSKKHTLKDWVEYTEQTLVESEQIEEKAVSKAQQKFMGMVHAAQKGKKPASKEVAKVAKSMGKKDAKDFASTKHKGLPEKVKEELKGGQKNLDKNQNGKLDSQDFKMLRSGKKKVKEGVNFAEMMRETQMTIEEMLEGLQQEIAEFKASGHMGEKLRDALDIHRHSNKDKLMGEMSMMAQPMVEEPVEESPFSYAAKQAKASGKDSFKLGGETFPVKESEEVEESGLQAYLGNKKYGKEGMDALRKAGREGASKEKMASIRAKHDKMDEDGPGSAQLYGDGDSDFNPVRSLKQLANKGIDAWNDYEQGKKDRWDAALGGNAGYIPGTLPRFDVDNVDKNKPDVAKGKFQELPKSDFKMKPEPLPDITDREKPYRDERTGKMVYPPKGLSISEPYGKEAMKKKSVKESLEFNLWDSQLEKMLNESLTVTTTQGDNDQEDSVSITASGEKASEIMALLRNAGLDSMSPEVSPEVSDVEPEQMLSAYGVPMSNDSEESSSGNDDIMSLMQKLSGLAMGDMGDSGEMHVIDVDTEHDEEDSEDYKDEEGSEDENEKENETEEGSDDEDSNDEEEKVDEAYGQADEGNAFTGKLAQTQQGGEFELDGKKYKDTSSLEEGEGMCQECGMYEGECGHMNEGVKLQGTIKPTDDGGEEYVPEPGYRVKATYDQGSTEKPKMGFVKSEPEMKIPQATSPQQSQDNTNENLESARPIEEELANGADDTTMQDIKYLIKTLAGGLNKEKRDQTTLPHTAVRMTEDVISDWKKLSGIK